VKPPTQCTCHVHATEDLSKHSRDLKLNRRVRRDCLDQVRRSRDLLQLETDPKERAFLQQVITCAEWTAWTCLLIIREARP